MPKVHFKAFSFFLLERKQHLPVYQEKISAMLDMMDNTSKSVKVKSIYCNIISSDEKFTIHSSASVPIFPRNEFV